MSTENLRDKHGRLLGRVETKSDGTQQLRDEHGRLLGSYQPKTNTTRDQHGNLKGRGNILTSLL